MVSWEYSLALWLWLRVHIIFCPSFDWKAANSIVTYLITAHPALHPLPLQPSTTPAPRLARSPPSVVVCCDPW